MRRNDTQHGLLEAERFAEISVEDAREVPAVLDADGEIEAECVPKLVQILSACAFAEHLLNGVAGHDVREQENHGENEPERGKSEEKAETEVARHLLPPSFAPIFSLGTPRTPSAGGVTGCASASATACWAALRAAARADGRRGLAAFAFAFGRDGAIEDSVAAAFSSLGAPAAGAAAGTSSGLIFTREILRWSISITVKR